MSPGIYAPARTEPCACTRLPDLIDLERHRSFLDGTVRCATGHWVHLHECSACGQRWRVDEWDKYQTAFAVRIPPDADWQTFDAQPLRLAHLQQARGGLTAEKCIWQGCDARRLSGSYHCIGHLHQSGTRD